MPATKQQRRKAAAMAASAIDRIGVPRMQCVPDKDGHTLLLVARASGLVEGRVQGAMRSGPRPGDWPGPSCVCYPSPVAQVFQLAGEVRTTAISFDVVVSSGFTFLRDVNGALVLDVNGTPIPVFA